MPMTEIGGQKVSVDNDHTEATKKWAKLQLDWKSPKLAKLNLEPGPLSWHWLHCYQDRQRFCLTDKRTGWTMDAGVWKLTKLTKFYLEPRVI